MSFLLLWVFFSSLFSMDRYEESIRPGWHQSFEISKEIYHGQVDGEDLLIFDNRTFGKVLVVNGELRLTEKDEFIYHEMMVHPALLGHGKPTSVLIIGGETGGVLREVLRHIDVRKVVVLERQHRSREVIGAALPELAKGAFEDPRVTFLSEDPFNFFLCSQDSFEVILCDPLAYNPDWCAREFYEGCKIRLANGGIFVNAAGVPFLEREALKISIKKRKPFFDYVTFFLASIPSHMGGLFAFGWASDVQHTAPLETLKKRMGKISGPLRYYTPAIQRSAFCLPHFMLPPEKKRSNKE